MSNAQTIASIVAMSKKIGATEESKLWLERLMHELDQSTTTDEQALLARLCAWATTRAGMEQD